MAFTDAAVDIILEGSVGSEGEVVMGCIWLCMAVDMRTEPSVPLMGVSSVSRCATCIMLPAFGC
jgi:hypothetical protein